MPEKPTSHGRCQGLPPGQAVVGPPWKIAAVVAECLNTEPGENTTLGSPMQV
jgi:hypothetical protein